MAAPRERPLRRSFGRSKRRQGYDVEIDTITGTYTDPGHVMAYDDSEVRQQFSLAFRARLVGGEPRTSIESDRVEWVDPHKLDELELHPSMRLRIAHALVGDERPVIG